MPDDNRKKRDPAFDEQAWQQKRAKSLAEYNRRKAEREERRAANTDDPVRAAAARRAAEMYRARIPSTDNGAAPPAAGGGGAGNAAARALPVNVAKLRVEKDVLLVKVEMLTREVDKLRRELEQIKAAGDRLTGERNITPDSGFIEIDRSVPTHPVVRFRADCLPDGGGGNYVAGDDTNITFVECTDPEDARYGKIMIDVYYV